MRLTVLGCEGPYPSVGGACSSYLLEADGNTLLIDAGSGALARVQRYYPLDKLDAVLVTHLHFDHMGELPLLRYALGLMATTGERVEPLPVYAPGEPESVRVLISGGAFNDHTVRPGDTLSFGELSVTFFAAAHPVPALSVRFELNGRVLCYSGDTKPNPSLVEAARGADIFVCDSAFLHDALTPASPHGSARQAAETAHAAGAKRLILTHFPPGADRGALLSEARAVFPNVELAQPEAIYELG